MDGVVGEVGTDGTVVPGEPAPSCRAAGAVVWRIGWVVTVVTGAATPPPVPATTTVIAACGSGACPESWPAWCPEWVWW